MSLQRRGGLFGVILTFAVATIVLLVVLPYSALSAHGNPLPVAAAAASQNQAVFAPEPPVLGTEHKPRRVAIVGAGASGSAAAFFLRRAAREAESRAGLEPGSLLGDLIVFERESYVGGRSTVVYPHGDENLAPHELGASIFVDANQNLMKAVKLFNLSFDQPTFSEAGVAIWDGQEFLIETSATKSRMSNWWDALAFVRRYGVLSPYRQSTAVKDLLKRFKRLYEPQWLAQRGIVTDIDDFAESAELGRGLTTRTGEDWATNVARVGKLWMDEIIEASTRVNYCADIDGIHGLGAAVSLAAGGASSVAGGNYQIFERMLKDSLADVRLQTEVTEIIPGKEESSFRVVTNSSKSGKDEEFDQVFFAAPWHLSPIDKTIAKNFAKKIPEQDYVHLHVTLLTTNAPWPSPAYFGLLDYRPIPGTILTTDATYRKTGEREFYPAFQSISYHGETFPGSGEYVVKLFSKKKLANDFLQTLFNSTPTWVLRKEWDSYPVLNPIVAYAPVEPLPGFHYLAGLEPWISTMETQTLSAREAVARVATKWWGLGLGQCRGGESWDLTCE